MNGLTYTFSGLSPVLPSFTIRLVKVYCGDKAYNDHLSFLDMNGSTYTFSGLSKVLPRYMVLLFKDYQEIKYKTTTYSFWI